MLAENAIRGQSKAANKQGLSEKMLWTAPGSLWLNLCRLARIQILIIVRGLHFLRDFGH